MCITIFKIFYNKFFKRKREMYTQTENEILNDNIHTDLIDTCILIEEDDEWKKFIWTKKEDFL